MTLTFALRDARGADVGALTVIAHGAIGELRLNWSPGDEPPTRASWRAAFDAIDDAASRSGIHHLEARVRAEAGDPRAPSYDEALAEAGLHLDHERREIRVPVAEILAGPTPSPTLSWRLVPLETPASPELRNIADLLRETSAGDPDADPAEDAAAFLLGAAHPSGVLVGADDRGPAALVVPTLSPSGDVGTLSWLGIAPRARRRGLGREAMWRGLLQLHALGATIWCDGTRADNHGAARLAGRDVPWTAVRVWRRTIAANSASSPGPRTTRDGAAS